MAGKEVELLAFQVNGLIKKEIYARRGSGRSISYLNFHLHIYLRNTLSYKDFPHIQLFVSQKFAGFFVDGIYKPELNLKNSSAAFPQTEIINTKGSDIVCLTRFIAAARRNKAGLVISIISDFKSLLARLSPINVNEIQNFLLIVDISKADYSNKAHVNLANSGWQVLLFENQSFASLVTVMDKTRTLIAQKRPVIVLVKTFWSQIIL